MKPVGSTALRRGVYPGSFNPPTVAHLAIALTALADHRLDRVDLVVSTAALGKPAPKGPALSERIEVIEASIQAHHGLAVTVTDRQLLVDIAEGYDVVVLGADKWAQVNDPRWYDHDVVRRDRAVAALPTLAIAPRPPFEVPEPHALDIHEAMWTVSSTAARSGRPDWMTDAARRSGRW